MENKPKKDKKKRESMCAWVASELCLHRYPWGFECVIMYVRYECHFLIGVGTEAELLIQLSTNRAALLQCSPDLLNDVRGLCGRIVVPL